MSNKKQENMKKDQNPYLEKPETLDPTEKNKEYKYGGGGEKDDSEK